jgi:RimJ/RimL family protein N-acetyltransferase
VSDHRTAPELHTERLVLRGWREADREPFAALNADPEVMRYFPATMTRSECDAFIDQVGTRWADGGPSWWAVEVIDGAPCIGFVGLSVVRPDSPVAPAVEIGWRLARDHWGRGYATEAAIASLRYGFDELDLDEIVSFTVPANTASRRVMERIGMRYDSGSDFVHPALGPDHPLGHHVVHRINRER